MRSDIKEGHGLVMSVKDGEYFVITRDGRYMRFRVAGVAPLPGQIVHLPVPVSAATTAPVFARRATRLALAASLVMAIGLGATLAAVQRHAVAYLAVDINPSVELALNYAGRVVVTKALNNDGAVVLDHVAGGKQGLLRQTAREALTTIMRAAISQGYLSHGEENVIQVTLVGGGGGIPSTETLRNETAAIVDREGVQAYLRVRSTGRAARDEARKAGVSVNELLLGEEMERRGMAPLTPGAEASAREVIRRLGAANFFEANEFVGRRGEQQDAREKPRESGGGSPRENDSKVRPAPPAKGRATQERGPSTNDPQSDDFSTPSRGPGNGVDTEQDSGHSPMRPQSRRDSAPSSTSGSAPSPAPGSTPREDDPAAQSRGEQQEQRDDAAQGENDEDEPSKGDRGKVRKSGE